MILLFTVVGILAVIGLYTVAVLTGQLFCRSERIGVLVCVETEADANRLDFLLYEAERLFLHRKSVKMAVLMAEELLPKEEEQKKMLAELLECHRAVLYVIQEGGKVNHVGMGRESDR